MTHTTYIIGNGNTSKKNNPSNLFNFRKSTDYSKTLDDIIAANIIAANPYLKKCTTKKSNPCNSCTCCPFKCGLMKGDDEFAKAAEFLANYKKKSAKAPMNLPFKLNTLYKLSNGSSIIFYDDEFQIGCDIYKYDDFGSIDFINSLTPAKKNIIINILGATNINININ